MQSTPTAVIGDIHGCSEELRALLRRVGDRRIVSLGDVVDRGPDPDGCIAMLREAEADVVLGNHEDKHLRYRRHLLRSEGDASYRIPMQLAPHHHETQSLVQKDNWAWLEERCVPFLRLPEHGVLAVHAGLTAGLAPERHKPERICRVQMTKPGLGDKSSPWGGWRRADDGSPELAGPGAKAVEDGYRWWTELYEGDDVVVYGHSVFPTPFATRKVDPATNQEPGVRHSFVEGEHVERARLVALGIDTGAPFGGALTALLLPEWSLVRVDARARYFGGPIDES